MVYRPAGQVPGLQGGSPARRKAFRSAGKGICPAGNAKKLLLPDFQDPVLLIYKAPAWESIIPEVPASG